MLPYILFIAVMVFLHYKKWPGAMIVVMMLFAVMRYETGWDYHMYYSFSTESGYFWAMKRYSWFWQMLFTFGRAIAMPHVPIAITGVLIYTLLYIGLKWLYRSNSKGMADTLLIYTAWPFFYLTSLTNIRQCLAMSVVVCIFACLNSRWGWKKKIPLLVLMYYMAFLFHPSSLVMLALIPVYIFRKVLNLKMTFIVLAIGLAIMASVQMLFSFLEGSQFGKYGDYLNQEDSYGGKLSIILAVIAIYLFVAGLSKKKKLLSMEFQQAYFLSLIGVVFTAAAYGLMTTSVAARMTNYFALFMMFTLYPCAFCTPYYRVVRNGITVAFPLFFLFYLAYTSVGTEGLASASFVPYRSLIELL